MLAEREKQKIYGSYSKLCKILYKDLWSIASSVVRNYGSLEHFIIFFRLHYFIFLKWSKFKTAIWSSFTSDFINDMNKCWYVLSSRTEHEFFCTSMENMQLCLQIIMKAQKYSNSSTSATIKQSICLPSMSLIVQNRNFSWKHVMLDLILKMIPKQWFQEITI